MKLQVKNFGMIKEADVSIDGLTIVTGENDTGKSTIGKVMFALVRALNKYEKEFEQDVKELMENQLESIYFSLRKKIDFEKNFNIKSLFFPSNSIEEILSIQEEYDKEMMEDKINVFISKRINALANQDIEEIKDIPEKLNELKKLLLNTAEDEIIKRAINKALRSEFQDDMNYKFGQEECGLITCLDGNNDILKVTVKNNKVRELSFEDKINFRDVTYIESPVIFYLNNFLNIPTPFRKRSPLPLHMSDLLLKLQISNYFPETTLEEELLYYSKSKGQVSSKIQEIIQGNIDYKSDAKDFYYSKMSNNETISIKTSNIATGIKAFGMIQLLLKAHLLNERSLLIIDEPEIHLHPKWQLEYAKLIVELVENKIPILLTTHSPYMLQALKVYSERANISNITRFYLAEREEGQNYSIFQDVTNDLNKVFKKLSDPFQELVWS